MSTSSNATGRLRRGWDYYRRYTTQRTGVHAGATAALTVFGLLAYFQRWFVVIAIVAYLTPPIYLYLTGDDLAEPEPADETADAERRAPTSADDGSPRIVRQSPTNGDADADGSDADADGDGDDGDTDSDSDSDDGDTDSDSDSDDGDTDSDSDNGDGDSDSDSDG